MPVELIKSVIDDLACPEGKREAMFFDKKLPGFGIRVSSKGQKTFWVQYNRRGTVKRVILGRMGVITAAEARRKAMELIGVVQAR
jgi:hypothetical protein